MPPPLPSGPPGSSSFGGPRASALPDLEEGPTFVRLNSPGASEPALGVPGVCSRWAMAYATAGVLARATGDVRGLQGDVGVWDQEAACGASSGLLRVVCGRSRDVWDLRSEKRDSCTEKKARACHLFFLR